MKQKIRLVTQQNKAYCGPASVKMVLDFYRIAKTQDEIGKLLGVTRKNGCDIPENIGKFKKLGLEAKYKKNYSLKEVELDLKKDIHPILYWDRNGDGHYSVFVGIDKKRVYVADPGNSKRIISLTRERFLERWKDPKNPQDKREIIIIKRG